MFSSSTIQKVLIKLNVASVYDQWIYYRIMENLDFKLIKTQSAVSEMHELFDFISIDEVDAYYSKSLSKRF